MARMGVFSRKDDTPEPIPRSLQLLSHRKSFDARYMEIYPNFSEILYPNESISLNVTNFVRSFPMKRPQMSRVRVYQSFVAVPLRLMWSAWEDYIKGENDAEFLYEEPYIVNATDGGETNQVSGIGHNGISFDGGNVKVVSASGAVVVSEVTPVDDTTVTSSGAKLRGVLLDRNSYVSQRLLGGDTTASYVGDDTRKTYMKVGVHELADYFCHPLYVSSGKNFISGYGKVEEPFSAFKFCAYQLAYSYFERAVNVQTRQDDYYEMSQLSCWDFPSVITCVNPDNVPVPPFTYHDSQNVRTNCPMIKKVKTVSSGTITATEDPRNVALGTSRGDKLRTCWEFVEKFPLKSGPNLSMLASQPNQVTGLPEYVQSNISLTRKRFANWQTDYFTSCNPWQQRGDEVQIPVNGSVSVNIDGVTFSLTGASVTIPRLNIGADLVDGSYNKLGTSEKVTAITRLTDSPPDYYTFDKLSFEQNTIDEQDESNVSWAHLMFPEHTASISESATSTASGTATASTSLYVSPSQFRFAMTLQHIKEAQASIDNRYQSYIRKFFGARARDYRLDRPEFLGGSVMELNVSDVTQTSQSTSDSLLGDLAGKSVTAGSSRTIRYHADEHTVILGLIHIMPDTEYIGGMSRVDSTKDRFDWAMPQFSHLAEQAVYNKELTFSGITNYQLDTIQKTVFGYEPIMNHLRWRPNVACGAFRDTLNSTGTYAEYKPWLITRDFGAKVSDNGYIVFETPSLSDKFLSGRYNRDNSNFDVTDDEILYPFMIDSYFNERLVRIISSRGNPTRLGA